jgi:hypothetical protein
MPSRPYQIRNMVQESRQSVIHASGPPDYWNVCGEHVLFVWYGNSIITYAHAFGLLPFLFPGSFTMHDHVVK